MRRFRHLSRATLNGWLEGSIDEPTIDEHLATCERCAIALEELEAPAEPELGAALAFVYRAPGDLTERLERKVTNRLDSLVLFDLAADLFGAGVETSKLLMTEEGIDE